MVSGKELSSEYIIPSPQNPGIKDAVAKAVAEAAIKSGVARIKK